MIQRGSLYSQFIAPGDLCFDIGANAGSRTDSFLELGAQVVAVEPQPDCYERLVERYRDDSRVTVIKAGLAEHEGTMSLSLCSAASTIATFSKKWKTGRFSDYTWDSTIDVPITTLNRLIERHGRPTFCKIDVEGFEHQVLLGLSSVIPFISFEFTKEFMEDAAFCAKRLMSLGEVEFNFSIGETAEPALSEWIGAREIIARLRAISDELLWGDIYAKFALSP